MEKQHSTTKNAALKLCITAMFAALLVGGKEALAVLPNVEVVTLITAVCAYVWGLGIALPAVCTFILCDVAIWGVNTWVISYLVHWNAVVLCFWAFSKIPVKNRVLSTAMADVLAVVLSACFGVLTSAVDTVVGFTGKGFFVDGADFLKRFCAMYVAGVSFYVTQIVTNAVLFAAAFYPLVVVNRRAKTKMFPPVDDVDNSPTE